MSLNQQDTIIVIIVCTIVGFLLLVLIVCFILWCIIRQYRLRSKRFESSDERNVQTTSSYRQQCPRWQKSACTSKAEHKHTKRKKRPRLNTNESSISLSFDPPHLINQNVKHLDKLFNSDATQSTSSWHYEQTLPSKIR
jgi:hypothetical protein